MDATQGPPGTGGGRDDDQERYRRGMVDHHDPTGGLWGAPPARSALTLRLVLAGIGLVACVAIAVRTVAVDGPGLLVGAALVAAAVAVVDLVVIARRKRRGEPG